MKKAMLVQAEYIIDVPFHDIDALEVVWHGHYVKYFELARCELLRKIDYDYDQMRESKYAWPVIDMKIRYVKGLGYAEKGRVIAGIVEYENRLKIDYLIERIDTKEVLTKGYTVQAAYNMEKQQLELATPDILRRKIQRFL